MCVHVRMRGNSSIYIDIPSSPSNMCENSLVVYCGKCCLLTVAIGNFQMLQKIPGPLGHVKLPGANCFTCVLGTVTVFSFCFGVFHNVCFFLVVYLFLFNSFEEW